jgi:hypothetical protein
MKGLASHAGRLPQLLIFEMLKQWIRQKQFDNSSIGVYALM